MDTIRNFVRKHGLILAAAVGAILIIIIIISLVASGGERIVLRIPESGSTVITGESIRKTTGKDFEDVSLSLPAGTHVIVAHPGMWPWEKTVEDDGQTHFEVFTLPELGADPEPVADEELIVKLQELRTSTSSPALSATSTSGNVSVAYSDGKIVASPSTARSARDLFCTRGTCDKSITILEPETAINRVAFMPGYESVILYSNAEGIFALEIEKGNTQNFQPLLQGRNLDFVVLDEDIYVFQGERVLLLRRDGR